MLWSEAAGDIAPLRNLIDFSTSAFVIRVAVGGANFSPFFGITFKSLSGSLF